MILSEQAKNSVILYTHQDPQKIEMLLRMQRESVVNELKAYYNASTIDELAIKLSMGYGKVDD